MDSSSFWCHLEKTNQTHFSPLNVFFFWCSCGEQMKVLLRSSLTALHTPWGPFAYCFVEPVRCSDESEVPLGEEYAEPSVK